MLPKSFHGLLQLLEKTISYQSDLSQEPNSFKDFPPYIHSSFDFLEYLGENHADILERLDEIEAEYFAKRHPELAEQIKQGWQFHHMPSERRIEGLPSAWLEAASNLGDDWFPLAKKLNKARNKAAHSYEPSAIARAFGFVGPQTVDKVRAKCLQLLKNLLGITLNADGTHRSVEPG